MKQISLLLFILISLLPKLYSQEVQGLFPGEKLTYKIHLGFIHAAEATIKTARQSESISTKKTYKIEVFGKTLGIFNLLTPVEDYWSANLTADELLPLRTEFRKREVGYRKQESVQFFPEKEIAKIHSIQNNPTDKIQEISKTCRDLISGYFFLRNQNINQAKAGQKFTAKILMDSKIYDLWVIVKGNDTIENNLGKRNCVRASMVLPKNNLFEDQDAIRIWISDDKYQVPYKIEVQLKFGHLSIDLVDYQINDKKIY